MYNCFYKFLETNNLIYSLHLGFRKKHSTSHALIHPTDKIREQLDEGNFACSIFVDFQKAFDTADHQILIQKLNYYVWHKRNWKELVFFLPSKQNSIF